MPLAMSFGVLTKLSGVARSAWARTSSINSIAEFSPAAGKFPSLPTFIHSRQPARLDLHLWRHLPARAVGAAMIMPYVTTEAMNKHLLEISAEVAPGAHAALDCDKAGWHQRGKTLVVTGNIALLSLPPYSPELNPMENVWDYLRQNKHCAQVGPSYDDILDACQSAWRFLINNPDRIRSIGTREWIVSLSRRTGIKTRFASGAWPRPAPCRSIRH
jgi:hypothetical protein